MGFTAMGAKDAKDENELSKLILDGAFRVHTAIGPDFWRALIRRALHMSCAALD